LAPRAGLEPAT